MRSDGMRPRRADPRYWAAVARDVTGLGRRAKAGGARAADGAGASRFARAIAPELDQLRRDVAAVAATEGDVVAGPFISEVGYELLYWIPFLRWATAEFPSLRGRLTVLSRGDTASWTADMADRYIDVFDLRAPDEVLHARVAQKQRTPGRFEEELVLEARKAGSLRPGPTLHPSLLFNFYYRALKIDQRAFARSVEPATDGSARGLAAVYAPIEPAPALDGLPTEYVAVRFYARPSFPDVEEIRSFVRRAVDGIAAHTPVVLLDTGMVLDDHTDLLEAGDQIAALRDRVSAAGNLGVQTAAVAGARALVGTYGGMSYLAPMLGRPAVGFVADPAYVQPWHLDLAQAVCNAAGWPSVVVLQPQDLDVLTLLTTASSNQ